MNVHTAKLERTIIEKLWYKTKEISLNIILTLDS